MQAYSIMRHSLRQVWGNLGDALRISGVLFAIYAVVEILLVAPSMGRVMAQGHSAALLNVLISGVLSLVLSIWMTVAWHRFVLLSERPDRLVPQLYLDRVLAYVGFTFVTMAILMVCIFAAVLLSTFLPGMGLPLLVTGVVLGLYLVIRISPVLPAAAVGKKLSLSQAWEATRPGAADLLLVTLAEIVLVLLLQFLPDFFVFSGVVHLIAQLISVWLVLITTASVLTTVYGHYVEGRQLI